MPIYEYLCKKCNVVEEKFFKNFNHTEIIYCQNCNSKAYKIIAHSNFHLKGPGWGKDGYNKKNVKTN